MDCDKRPRRFPANDVLEYVGLGLGDSARLGRLFKACSCEDWMSLHGIDWFEVFTSGVIGAMCAVGVVMVRSYLRG
jgi:hypothetical protein